MQKVKILTLGKKIARRRSLKQKLNEKIGEISAIIHNLNLAYEKGLFSGKGKLVKFIQTFSGNIPGMICSQSNSMSALE